MTQPTLSFSFGIRLLSLCAAVCAHSALASFLPATGYENGVSSTPLFLDHDLGSQSVAIILVNFEDDTSMPITPEYAAALGQRLSRFIQNESYGRASVTSQVFGWWTLPKVVGNPKFTPCDFGGKSFNPLLNEVLDYSTSQNINLKSFDRLIIYYQYAPKGTSCTYEGAGNSPLGEYEGFKGVSEIQVKYANDFGLGWAAGTIQHEFGHGLGFNHPSVWSCGSNVLSNSCLLGEGTTKLVDPWDQMASWDEYNAVEKYAAGWIQPNEVIHVTQGGTYTLYPEELAESKTKLITFDGIDPRTSRKMTYYVEFRQPLNADEEPVQLGNPNSIGNILRRFLAPPTASSLHLSAEDLLNSDMSFRGSIAANGDAAKGVIIRTARQNFNDQGTPLTLTTDLINANAAQYASNENDINSNHNAALTENETFIDPTTKSQMSVVSIKTGANGAAVLKFNLSAMAAPYVQIEAEDPSNDLGGGAYVESCPSCSGGSSVAGLGRTGYLTFNDLYVESTGQYSVEVYFLNSDLSMRRGYYDVNGVNPLGISFVSTLIQKVPSKIILTLQLHAGNNSISFFGNSPLADIDRLVLN